MSWSISRKLYFLKFVLKETTKQINNESVISKLPRLFLISGVGIEYRSFVRNSTIAMQIKMLILSL